ncbi:thiamine pyrophosphate-binding protein [Marinicaulis aureus]|uniref:Thiamine pyrophosphate-binding protein n=1 Tax=Hyphococcus aureus TaxID=2666033 RepID=A0ABW1KZ52_9PROT
MTKEKKDKSLTVDRRRLLTSSLAGGLAASAAGPVTARAQAPAESEKAPAPTRAEKQMEEGDIASIDQYGPELSDRYFVERPGSDVMVDVIRSVGLPYMSLNPASSFRGLQESIVNYAGNKNPQIITATHEEQAVAIAHGYAKASGKPMGVLAHGTVGIQHAAMAVYNAYVDRAPMIIMGSTHADSSKRSSYIDWNHSAHDTGKIIRDFTKWDAAPISMQAFAEDFSRAMKIALTPPYGPVYLALDAHIQEEEAANLSIDIPKFIKGAPPVADENAVEEIAQLLVNAENPVIVADMFANTPDGMDLLIEIAEAVNAPVVDLCGRMNFPTTHYLCQTANEDDLILDADFILGLEVQDPWGVVNRMTGGRRHGAPMRKARDDAKVALIGVNDLFLKSNYQSFQRYFPADISASGDGEATAPLLLEKIKAAITPAHITRYEERGQKWREAHKVQREASLDAARYGWGASPVSLARLCAELWPKIKDREWMLTPRGGGTFLSRWPQRLWDFDKHHNHIGDSGAAGVGYGAPASVGAALANKETGRLTVNIQGDGDFLYVPGAFWTAAHHNLPLLTIMHNNGGYHQEVMHLQRMAAERRRGVGGPVTHHGLKFENPGVDFASVAKGLGVWSTGPIDNPNDLSRVLDSALDVIGQGEPALIDVLCQPR